MKDDADNGTPGKDPNQQGVNTGGKSDILFMVDEESYPLIFTGFKRWHAVKWDMRDDRMYRLGQGHTYHGQLPTHENRWSPDVKQILIQHEETGEVLTLEFKGIEFTPWSPGWAFLILGDVLDVGVARVEGAETFERSVGPEDLPW